MKRVVLRSRVTQDRWLVSYADFITLMFGFFVVLFAFSRADRNRQAQIIRSISTAFNVRSQSSQPVRNGPDAGVAAVGPMAASYPTGMVDDGRSLAQVRNELNLAQQDLETSLAGQIKSHSVSVFMGREGLVISLREAGFFASGSADPGTQTLPILREVAASLARNSLDLRIEGHTDSVPIHSSEFDSNWELSAARATRIARLLLNLNVVSPDRISAAGYAGYRPTASNASEAGRAENRRVELVMAPHSNLDFSRPNSPQVGGAWRRVNGD